MSHREPQSSEAQPNTANALQERQGDPYEADMGRYFDELEASYRERVAQLDEWLVEQSKQGEAAQREAMEAIEATLRSEFEESFTYLHSELTGYLERSIETLLARASGTDASLKARLELADQVRESLTRMCSLEQRVAINELTLAKHGDLLGRLDAAFGDEAEKRIAYTAFREELTRHPTRSAFFVAFVGRFGAQLESIKLFYGGLIERAQTKGEGTFDTVAAVAEHIPLFGTLAKVVVDGVKKATVTRKQDRKLTAPSGSLALLEADSQKVAQEIGYAIVTTFAKRIDQIEESVPSRHRSSEVKKKKYIDSLIEKRADAITKALFDHITTRELTDEPLADQLLEVIELSQTELFGLEQPVAIESQLSKATRTQVAQVGQGQQSQAEQIALMQQQMQMMVAQQQRQMELMAAKMDEQAQELARLKREEGEGAADE